MPDETPRIAIDYLGCKVNQAEVEEIGARFLEAGYAIAAPGEPADVYVLNSCTVTHVADRKTRLLIHQAARRTPRPLIVVTGCYPTVDPAGVAAINGVDLVVANDEKSRLVEIIGARLPLHQGTPPADRRSILERTRAMLKVQDGCEHFCTYCIVPAARGGNRSVPPHQVIASIRRLIDQGVQEVVLTGVALGSYGAEAEPSESSAPLAALLSDILAKTELRRLRLSSIEPERAGPALISLWSDRRLCRHIHLPLQSGADSILKRMGRRYRSAEFAALVQQARAVASDMAITTDVIVGFPGETDEEHSASLDFARSIAFARIHVFRFSPRRGTPASRLPGRVPEHVKRSRADQFSVLSDDASRAFRQRFVGTTRDVLWEERRSVNGAQWWSGLTDNYIRVYAMSSRNLANTVTTATLSGELDDGLCASA